MFRRMSLTMKRLLLAGSVALSLALFLGSLHAQAQSTTDYFLHGSGGPANPPTLFLNPTAPTDTIVKYKDSTSVNFNGGNPWKEVGTWPTTPVPPAGTLTTVEPVHIWLGLKNSDDQGTKFDLLAELSKNGVVVTSALTRCITGIRRNPALALEVTVSFGSMASELLNGTSDSLSLKLSTRIGTNSDNTKCAGHNNAVGLRLYFDATNRQSRFGTAFGAANQGPNAVPGGPYSGNVGQPIAFDGSGSSDPENNPLTFTWDFGDGTTGSGPTPTHTYSNPGTFTVSLTVNDGQGNTHTASTLARILGTLTQARVSHTATLLANGKVLLAGGTGPSAVLNSVELFDPITLSSTALTNSLTTTRTEHTATLLPQTETLLIAGQDGLGLLFSTEMFNLSSKSFRALAPTVQVLRSGHTATGLLDGRVLITGGQSSGALGSGEVFDAQSAVLFRPSYDPEAGTFTILPNGLVTPRWDHTATLLPDGRILIVGGRNDSGVLASAEIFDPATETFTALAAILTTPRAGHTATLLSDGRVLLLGGEGAAGTLVSAEVFIPTTETFAAITPGLATPRANHTATLLPIGLVLITGGQSSSGGLASTEQYSPSPTDTTAPIVSQVNPPNGATDVDLTQIVGVRFSEPVDVRNLTATSVTLANGGPVSATMSPGEQGLMIFLVPSAPLTAGTTYTLSLTTAIKDTSGNPLVPYTSQFTTVAVPAITGFTPDNGPPDTAVTISGQNFDPVESNNQVTFNGVIATVTAAAATSLTATVPSGATSGPITVTTRGGTATSATNFTVITGPTITSFSPTSGPVGTTVTITGQNFDAVAANNQVKFNGKPAIITLVPGTSITTTVPQGATTGPITVTTAQGMATSAQAFTVTAPDFSLSALPTPLTIPATAQGAIAVSVSGTSGFTNLVTLSVTGVPSGAAAAFSSATLTAGQSAFLTIVTNGTTPAGTYPLTVNATGLMNGVQTTRSAMANVQVLSGGTTTLAGQVRDEDDKPVKAAVVKLGSLQVTTDDGGNFLLQNPPVGADQLFFIDGGPASTPGRNLPIIPYKVTIVAGQANVLGFIPKLHFQKTTGLVDISNSAVERAVADPEIPGFQMTIPAGATITGWDGQPNTQISIRRVPIDRTPLPPLPGDRYSPTVYMDYFGKPGGGTPSEPIPITFPNDLELPPGTQVELWFYDEAPDGSRPNQWAQYGTGTVSADGSRVIPDINPATGKPFGQPRFCCGAARMAMLLQQMRPILDLLGGPSPSKGKNQGGDPVDLATGLFIMEKTDLTLPGRLPLVVTRTYRTNGAAAGPFGPGTSHPYHVLLLVQSDLRTLVLPGGLRLAFPKQADGKFRNTTDPSVRSAVLTEAGGTHTLRFKDGPTWTFGTPVFGTAFLIGQTDRNGNTITLTRSGQTQNITTMTAPDGRQLTLTYDGGNRIVQITDPLGRSVLYSYDAGGRLVSVVDPEGGVTRYTYDGTGRMLTITDARELTFLTNKYDSEGRVLRQTLADSGVWQFAYTTTAGIITQTTVTDPRGHVTTTRFNGQGYVLSQADALGQITASTRDPASNLLLATTDPLGRKTTFDYDAAGNVTTITDPENKITRFEYEPTFNRITKITDALNQITEFTYDSANGNLLTTRDPLNHVTTIAYNQFGQPTSVQGPIGTEPPTTFAYDTNGNLITTTDPLGNQTQRAYDTVSRLISLTDPRGLITQFRYDNLNRVTEIADAQHGLTAFTYDPNGNLLTVTDAKNQDTTYTYDNMDRLATRKDALNRQETYQYDPAGNLMQFTDRKNQQSTFQYDALNRRTQATYADATVTFTYDSVGRLARSSDSVSGTIDFNYDNLDRLIQEITAQGTVNYQYDALGRRTQMTANGQQPVTYQYDAASRLTQVAQGTQIVGLGYDNAGRRTSLTYPNGTSTSYQYDFASRLTNITHNSPTGLIESLTSNYDVAGNRISLIRGNGIATLLPQSVQAAYDAANEQIQFNSATPNLTYDANGNLQTLTDASGTTNYTWDARNRLTVITGPGLSASFAYDALGRRVSKTINSVTIRFLYDGSDIIQEIDGGAVGVSYLRSFRIDESFLRQSSSSEFVHTDALGSTIALTNLSGAAQATYIYEPFGKADVTGTSSNSFQYTGRENDGTGLYYYRARYYHPRSHRFMSPDPIGLASGDVNGYVYAGNSPLVHNDPLGLYERDVHYDLPLWLALQVGFSKEEAQIIATADQGLDDNIGTNALFNPLAGGYWHFTHEAQREDLWQQALGTNDLRYLGQFLHALQDSYSHDNMSAIPGHLRSLRSPDKTCNNLPKAEEMARDTYLHLRAYMIRKRGAVLPYEWDSLESVVGRKIRNLGGCGS